MESFEQLQALSSLLSPQQDEEDEDFREVAKLGPGHIGPPSKRDKNAPTPYKNIKDIWSEKEVSEGSQYGDDNDPRPRPEFEMVLKQSVRTEDVFLGLNGKNASSMCCEAFMVKIKLPDHKASDILLDVTERFLDLRTNRYKLGLHLPQPVHNQEGGARFHPQRGELEVTLMTKRPNMDVINLP